MLDEYLRFWREAELDKAPHVHKQDKALLLHDAVFKNIIDGNLDTLLRLQSLPDPKSLPNNEEAKKLKKEIQKLQRKLHLELLPAPHTGNLPNAKVIVVMINPGVSVASYAEAQIPALRDRDLANLRHEFDGSGIQISP